MKSDNLTDTQTFENTGKHLSEWKTILDQAKARDRTTNDIAVFLQKEHGVQRYWARTLTAWHAKQAE